MHICYFTEKQLYAKILTITMENLKSILKSIDSTLDKQELDSRFPEIAKTLMENYGIENSKGQIYFINEIEFYYYDSLYDDKRSGNSKKHITYERTAPSGSWFIHDYGVDITFESNQAKGFGGGILLRSIEESNTHKAFIGPKNCVNELWDEAVDAFSSTAPNPRIVKIEKRKIELNADTRVTVEKVDPYQSKWRFLVEGKTVSKK